MHYERIVHTLIRRHYERGSLHMRKPRTGWFMNEESIVKREHAVGRGAL